jgi:hypothetical protein
MLEVVSVARMAARKGSIPMADHSQMKLGRRAIRRDGRTLRLGAYLRPQLPAPPPRVDWTRGLAQWGMMLNDQLGDCTIAGCAHAVQLWSANTGAEVTLTDATVEQYYERWDGYNPADPEHTDNGGIELDVLKRWRKEGLAGHALLAFVDPRVSSLVEIRQSIALFGGVYIGLDLPLTARTQEVWEVVAEGGAEAEKGSWGGHCVFVVGYDEKGFTCISWGALKTMTVAFWRAYCDEAHTLLGADWIAAKAAPSGFDQQQLLADLRAIA